MEFLFVFSITVVLSAALREPLRRWPVVFYAISAAAVIAFLAGTNGLLDGSWWKPTIMLVQRCMVALSLFAVVMLIGVLPKNSRLDAWFRPIRAELSIVACILCAGHMCAYLAPYAARAMAGNLSGTMAASFAVTMVLFALVVVLGVTSFGFVKRRMNGRTWKSVQRMAYPFFGLVWAHLVFMLAPAALRGGEQAATSVTVYTALFAIYLALRLLRAQQDKQIPAESADTAQITE